MPSSTPDGSIDPSGPVPQVTVVVPAYNAVAWLPETLASIAGQTIPPEWLEVIVVDDQSSDGSAGLAREILGRSALRHQVLTVTNGGPSRARNIGWKLATAPWIQFLDADDLLVPHKIARQFEAATNQTEPPAVIYSPWTRLTGTGGDWKADDFIERPAIGDDPIMDLLHVRNFIAVGSYLMSRRWLERVAGFDESLSLIEDVHLLLRVAMAGGRYLEASSPEPLFFYRCRRGESLSSQSPITFSRAQARNLQLVQEFWEQNSMLTPARRRLLLEQYQGPLHIFAEAGGQPFDELYRRVLALDPHWLPSGPPPLRLLSRLVGYRRAEWASVAYRRLRGRRHR
ncbi:MAG TPA: hypothetical protein DEH78_31630 [Solibacterales bacterium]|nr:hypothetical protein [Bryobacterales bacterium]